MIIVSDTTAITSLIKINRTELLQDLFGEILVPSAVRAELLRFHAKLPAFIRERSVKNLRTVESFGNEDSVLAKANEL